MASKVGMLETTHTNIELKKQEAGKKQVSFWAINGNKITLKRHRSGEGSRSQDLLAFKGSCFFNRLCRDPMANPKHAHTHTNTAERQ